jgi:hypothetical protein
MADENINGGEEYRKNLERSRVQVEALKKDQKGVNDLVGEYINLTGQLVEKLKEQTSEVRESRADYGKYYELQQKIVENQKEIKDLRSSTSSLSEQLTKDESKVLDILKEGLTSRKTLSNLQNEASIAQAKYVDALRDGETSADRLKILKNESVKAAKALIGPQQASAKLSALLEENYEAIGENLDDNTKEIIQQIVQNKVIEDQLETHNKNYERAAKLLNSQLSIYDKIKGSLKITADTFRNTDIGKLWGEGVRKLQLSFNGILTNVLALNKSIVETSKLLGISVDTGEALSDSFRNSAYESSQTNKNLNVGLVTIKAQFQAQQELNAALGTSNLLTEQAREDQIFLTKQLGLSVKESTDLYKLGRLNNMGAADTAKVAVEQVANLKNQTGILLNYKTILGDISKVSAQLQAQYKNDPKLLAQAVIQVRLLGLEFEQASSAANKLLDFQSSIQNELKAELLIGKELNLEKARELALTGDVAGATKEMISQVGTLADYTNLNVLQQQALAESVGLSKNELAESLRQQELFRDTSFQSAKALEEALAAADSQADREKIKNELSKSTNADQLMSMYSQLDIQTKINSAFDKLTETIASLVDGPLGQLANGFTNILTQTETLKTIINAVAGIMAFNLGFGIAKSIQGMMAFVKITKSAAQAEKGLAAAKAISAGLTNPLALVAGLAAAGVGIAAVNSMLPGPDVGVSGASPGGGTGVNTPSPSQSNMNQNQEPVKVIIDNKFSIAGQDIGKVSSQQQINGSKFMDSTS